MSAAELLADHGVQAAVVRLLSVSDLDAGQICSRLSNKKYVFVMEEVCSGSGIRETLASAIHEHLPACHVTGVDLGHNYVTHGSVDSLYQEHGLDAQAVCNSILGVVCGEK